MANSEKNTTPYLGSEQKFFITKKPDLCLLFLCVCRRAASLRNTVSNVRILHPYSQPSDGETRKHVVWTQTLGFCDQI